ncbi:UrcA family protein [Brevundimonas sp.]|jgi:UrcA family protein|uniref:UrcA family protein n=1 Tax=Brevundimonas sp. TaxID=1871086 RepID=UPI0025B92920|nr:UrcA family protein [Brevundimonas sp.]
MTKTLLTLAAFTLLAAAPAAAQDSIRVSPNGLDLSTPAGAAAFDARVAAAARDACVTSSRRTPSAVCIRQIQREAIRQLPQARQDDYARARRSDSPQAMVAPAWPA